MAAVCTCSSQVLLAKSHPGAVSTTDTALCGRLLQPQPPLWSLHSSTVHQLRHYTLRGAKQGP